jgi:hypothetical protein
MVNNRRPLRGEEVGRALLGCSSRAAQDRRLGQALVSALVAVTAVGLVVSTFSTRATVLTYWDGADDHGAVMGQS